MRCGMLTNMQGDVRREFVLLIIIGIVVRFFFWLSYEPVYFADSPHYEWLAEYIINWDFSAYEGIRTPIYSLLLIMGGINWYGVWLWQSLLGILSSLLLYDLVRNEGGKWAFFAGLLPTIQINLLANEANILTETLATFLLLLAFWLWQRGQLKEWPTSITLTFGLVASFAGLTRPILLLLPCLAFLLALVDKRARRLQNLAAITLPFLLLAGSWSYFNWLTVGYFGPTTLTGYNLSRHSGAFVEHAPDEFATIRDIFLTYRDEENGDHTAAIWQARQDMQAATGYSYAELSQELTRMSLTLFWERKADYLRSVFNAWTQFWQKTAVLRLGTLKPGVIGVIVAMIWWFQSRVLLGLDLIFWLLVGQAIWHGFKSRSVTGGPYQLAILLVMVTSLAQAFLEYGENARYAIPYQPLIWYVVLVGTATFLRSHLPTRA